MIFLFLAINLADALLSVSAYLGLVSKPQPFCHAELGSASIKIPKQVRDDSF